MKQSRWMFDGEAKRFFNLIGPGRDPDGRGVVNLLARTGYGGGGLIESFSLRLCPDVEHDAVVMIGGADRIH
ncbi:hypothetical protein [Thermomonas hydrothermalis]|uniref:hypothetical protein n=1 Tax=Thermomonas hydrothermalis TaxID=213588 RepID=UPI0011604968|nr:hypothetical protein [Thermomonas hydrothermalis]